MAEFIKLIDITKCTGCRGCQVACKQWNELAAEKTTFTGSLQNPDDLSYNTWTLIRFDEVEQNGKMNWLLRHDACMHCDWPACVKACPSPGALVKTDEGPVVHNTKFCIGCKSCIVACPFDIPRYSKEKENIAKCTLCYDRITDGKNPACVTACPTGCLTFGTKEEMLDKAAKRAEKIGGFIYPNNPKYETHVLYIMPGGLKVADYSHANPNPKMPTTLMWWKNLFKPFTLIGIGGVAGLAALHYLIKGPHRVHEKKEEGGE
ncbi:MAG: 4Fe-4S dicluster domain-containing protein [Syntrophaceae bacterium]|nr:4Fe-4S dicluster domain-containing protein [Deltaproteobacteria bacterium]